MVQQTIPTKFKRPDVRKHYIVRERLFQQLQAVADYRLSILHSGAGSGKTMLLATFFERHPAMLSKWLSLDETMNEELVFWDCMLTLFADYLRQDREVYETYFLFCQQSDQKQEQFLALIVNDLQLDRDVYVVLDDFHFMKAPAILKMFDKFMQYAPVGFHFLLLTREKPAFYIADYEMKGQLFYLDERAFKLTYQEAFQFLQDTLALSLSEAAFQHLIALADGWIGGLQLLGSAAAHKSEGAILQLKAVNQMLKSYLSNEIYDVLTSEEQQFLLATACSSYVCKTLSKALFPNLDYDAMLEALVDKNLLLQCIDAKEKIYRYHHILKEYLMDKVEEQDKKVLHQTSATAFIEIQDYQEALQHLLCNENYQQMMQLLVRIPEDVKNGMYIKAIPVAAVVDNFEFAYQKFFYHYGNIEIDVCHEIYETVKPLIHEHSAFQEFSGLVTLLNNGYLDLDENIRFVEDLEKIKTNPATKALIFLKNATFLVYYDHYYEALKILERVEGLLQLSHSMMVAYFMGNLKAQILEEIGNLESALQQYDRLWVSLAEEQHKNHAMMITYCVSKAGVYLKRLQLPEVLDCLQQAKQLASKNEFDSFILAYLSNLSEYYYGIDDAEKGYAIFLELLAHSSYESILPFAYILRYPIVNKQLSSYHQTRFFHMYEHSNLENFNSKMSYFRLCHQNGNAVAIGAVDDVLQSVRKAGLSLKIVEAILLKMSIFYEQLESRELFNLYREAIYYAHDNKIKQPFHVEQATLKRMFQQYSLIAIIDPLSKVEKQFHKAIWDICMQQEALLSEREQDVLQALAKGYTNPQIAEQLCISLATVKTHVLNIYRKLEVNSRVSAMQKAEVLGLLDNGT